MTYEELHRARVMELSSRWYFLKKLKHPFDKKPTSSQLNEFVAIASRAVVLPDHPYTKWCEENIWGHRQ